jgi:hypothetical protein
MKELSRDATVITQRPADITLANTCPTSGVPLCQAMNSVNASEGVTIRGSVTVTFKAGSIIRLPPEFRAMAGSTGTTFQASIQRRQQTAPHDLKRTRRKK